jgi:hypothetical protein
VVQNSFPVLVRLLEMDFDEPETRLALEIAVERDTLDAPKWLPFDLVPARHQWKMSAALANLLRDLEDGQGGYRRLLEREHAVAIEVFNAEWEERAKELKTKLDTATDRAVGAERKLQQWKERSPQLAAQPEPPHPPEPPAATDGNAQLLIQALIRQTELVIERDAARAEAKRSDESLMQLGDQYRQIREQEAELACEMRSILTATNDAYQGCPVDGQGSNYNRIRMLGENLREAKRLNLELTKKLEDASREQTRCRDKWGADLDRVARERNAWQGAIEAHFHPNMTPADASYAIAQLKTNLKVATASAEQRGKEHDEAPATQTLPDVVRQFQQSAHQDMGDTFYCTQAGLRKSGAGSLNALTADVLDWAMGLHDVLVVVDQNTVTRLQTLVEALSMVPLDVAGRVQNAVNVDLYALSDMFRKVFGEGEKP